MLALSRKAFAKCWRLSFRRHNQVNITTFFSEENYFAEIIGLENIVSSSTFWYLYYNSWINLTCYIVNLVHKFVYWDSD